MNCPLDSGKPEVLLDYCAGRLGAAESLLLEQHLGGCVECGSFERAQRAVWSAMSEWESAPISADFNRRLYAAIEREDARGTLRKWLESLYARWTPLDWRPAVPVAAAALTMAVVIFVTSPAPRTLPPQPDSQVRIERIDVEQVERALDDVDLLKNLGSTSEASSTSM